MAKGTRLPEETKRDIADRYSNGEDVGELAERFGISQYTVRDYAKEFGKKRKRGGVKRKITVPSVRQEPKENTRVSDGMIADLKKQVEFWKDAFLTEFQKNSNK